MKPSEVHKATLLLAFFQRAMRHEGQTDQMLVEEALARVAREYPMETLAADVDIDALVRDVGDPDAKVPFDIESEQFCEWSKLHETMKEMRRLAKTLRFASLYSTSPQRWNMQHTVSGRLSTSKPALVNFPISSSYGKAPYIPHCTPESGLGRLRGVAEEDRHQADGPVEPASGHGGHRGRGAVVLGLGTALHQALERAHRKSDAGDRGAGPDGDGTGRGVRLVGAEQGSVRESDDGRRDGSE